MKLGNYNQNVIDIHYICHLINLCIKATVKVLPLKFEDILVIYYHFRHSIKSIATLKDYAEFCAVDFKSIKSTVRGGYP